ncbi:MAG: hypothetical protein M3O72_01200, partial [Verrucomicrobiota bacterium]|nr:hypothetical protein [Verrucomicrobiota bacterium]
MQDSPPPQKQKRSRVSAGLLMFRRKAASRTDSSGGENYILEVLLVHPGGPFFRNKDDGAWTIPKGEVGPGEDLLTR